MTVSGTPSLNTFIMEITPAQAKEFLRLNSRNRPLRPSWVKTLSEIIERGEWMVTHQGIAITRDNQLLDGQHRLAAVIRADITVQMQVTFDCDPATFMVMDGGIKRTVQDQLGIPGMVGTVARLLWRLPRHTDNAKPSSTQIDQVLSWSRPLIDEVVDAAGSKSKFSSGAILLPVCVHMMAGKAEVLPKMVALRTMDFDALPASLKTLTRQVIDGKATAVKTWDLSARAWRAFDPAKWSIQTLQLKDVTTAIGEMNRAVEIFRRRNVKKAA